MTAQIIKFPVERTRPPRRTAVENARMKTTGQLMFQIADPIVNEIAKQMNITDLEKFNEKIRKAWKMPPPLLTPDERS